jgi:hypothetical protein
MGRRESRERKRKRDEERRRKRGKVMGIGHEKVTLRNTFIFAELRQLIMNKKRTNCESKIRN